MRHDTEPSPEPSGIGKQPWEPMQVTLIGHVGEIVRGGQPPISQVKGKKVPPPDSDAFMRRAT